MNWGNKYLEKIKIIENRTINATISWLKKKNGINCGIELNNILLICS